jgi:predicted Zn-dependent protease
MLLQGAVLAAAVATREKRYANLAQMGASIGAQLINQKHGRDAERQSDHYGMIYMSRAGYDPQGAVDLQKTFVRLSESRRQDWLSGLFAGHPPSQERVENNARDAAALPKGGEVGRERYRLNMARLVKTKRASPPTKPMKRRKRHCQMVIFRRQSRWCEKPSPWSHARGTFIRCLAT